MTKSWTKYKIPTHHSESYTDIKGRVVEVDVYQYIDEYGEIKTIERRSFQDKNLLNSVTLHKEIK